MSKKLIKKNLVIQKTTKKNKQKIKFKNIYKKQQI